MSGYFRVQRGLFEHEAFRSTAPLSDREAWIWLIEHANWEPSRYRSGYTLFDVPRGALATHYRALAAKWRWDHKKVIRFLNMLQTEGMIRLETPHRSVQIILCNYDKYQRPWDSDAPEMPQENPTAAPQMGTNQIKERKEKNIYPPTPLPGWIPLPEWGAFKEMRKRQRSAMTAKAEQLAIAQLDRLRGEGHDPKFVIEQSILRNWKSFYPLKGESNEQPGRAGNAAKQSWASAGRELAEKYREDAEREEQAAVCRIADSNLRLAEDLR